MPVEIRNLWFQLLVAKRRNEAEQAENARGPDAPTAADRAEADELIAKAQAFVEAEQKGKTGD